MALVGWVWLSTAASALALWSIGVELDSPEPPVLPMLTATALSGIFVAVGILVRADFGALGLRRLSLRWWVPALLMLPIILVLSSGWVGLLEWVGVEPRAQQIAEVFTGTDDALRFALLLLYAVVFAPAVEELLLRGFLLVALVDRIGGRGAIGLSALLFGAMHLSDPQAVPPLVLLGVMLAWLRLRSDSLWPPILLHVTNNAVAVGLVLAT